MDSMHRCILVLKVSSWWDGVKEIATINRDMKKRMLMNVSGKGTVHLTTIPTFLSTTSTIVDILSTLNDNLMVQRMFWKFDDFQEALHEEWMDVDIWETLENQTLFSTEDMSVLLLLVFHDWLRVGEYFSMLYNPSKLNSVQNHLLKYKKNEQWLMFTCLLLSVSSYKGNQYDKSWCLSARMELYRIHSFLSLSSYEGKFLVGRCDGKCEHQQGHEEQDAE